MAPASHAVLPFGVDMMDRHLPGGGLRLGGLHDLADAGTGATHGSAAGLMAAGILARLSGPVLWVGERDDLFPAGLAGAGLHPDRVLHVQAPQAVALVLEEGLRHGGFAGVVGEVADLPPTPARRLQHAAEAAGLPAFLLRRPRKAGAAARDLPIPALTRWRLRRLPSGPVVPEAPEVPGLAPALWQVDLLRCRGAAPASWILEACDETGHLRLPALLGHRTVVPAAAGGRARRSG
ncbi:ImuA family protein [Acidisoma sp. 7E03]